MNHQIHHCFVLEGHVDLLQHNSTSDVMKQNVATPTTASTNNSPGKAVSLHSRYMEQLRELHSVFDLGALTAAEYKEQRSVIVDLMGQLKLIESDLLTKHLTTVLV